MFRPAFKASLAGALLTLGACATTAGPPPPPAQPKSVVRETRCADLNFPVYFGDQSADLTAAARKLIVDEGHGAPGCKAAQVEVVGLADYRGAADANLDLSRRRAGTVARALEQAGLPSPVFHLTAVGASGSVAPSGDPQLMRRRADVFIRFNQP